MRTRNPAAESTVLLPPRLEARDDLTDSSAHGLAAARALLRAAVHRTREPDTRADILRALALLPAER